LTTSFWCADSPIACAFFTAITQANDIPNGTEFRKSGAQLTGCRCLNHQKRNNEFSFRSMSEIRTIPGFSVYRCDSDGNVYGTRVERLKPMMTRPGYYTVNVLSDDGRRQTRLVHRLIALTFLGPIPEGMEVNHKNGIKGDNRAENLEYVTKSENHRHARDVLNRFYVSGERHGECKLTDEAVEAVRHLVSIGWTQKRIARAFGISQVLVSLINTGKRRAPPRCPGNLKANEI